MATIVKIDKTERDTVAKTLTECSMNHAFYTVEENDLLLACEIDCDSPSILWSLGKMVGIRTTNDGWYAEMTKQK